MLRAIKPMGPCSSAAPWAAAVNNRNLYAQDPSGNCFATPLNILGRTEFQPPQHFITSVRENPKSGHVCLHKQSSVSSEDFEEVG